MNAMKYEVLEGDVFDDVCQFSWDLMIFIREHQGETNKGFVAAIKHLKKANAILDKITEISQPLWEMYGPPEDVFSEKEEAEKELRREVMTKVINKKLLATQWKEIVKQILYEVPESRETIDRLISE